MATKGRVRSVAIIGTGFGGLGMGIALKKTGVDDFVIFEKENEVGGCWRDNRYPGAACDVPSHLYSFSFEPKTDWSRKFAPQPEILGYLKHCADKYGLRRHICFGSEVTAARYDEDRALWVVEIADGTTQEARMLVSACGQLNRPAYPRIPGLENFRGAQFHSARWDDSVALDGKAVAVIGSGASAIQFVPQIAGRVKQLHLFQRSAPYVIPKPDRAYHDAERRLFQRLPGVQRLDRWYQYWNHEVRALAFTRFASLMTPYKWRFHQAMRRHVRAADLRRRLEPDYPIGCKRVLISNDWFEALARPNVEVVTDAVREVVADGVRSADGRVRKVDTIIFGTGFAATDFLAPMRITGRGGRELNETWRAGAEAYLGMAVAGFPNLFMLYGPNTNLGHSSIVFMLESQIAYVMQAVERLGRGVRSIEVRTQVQQAFNRRLQERIRHTVWDQGCSSWYKTADGKNTNNWPGFTFEYRRATRRLHDRDYELQAAI